MSCIIVKVRIVHTYETCDRHSYYVALTNDVDQVIMPDCFQTGSIYNDYQGLSREEARDRALVMADRWASFLNLELEPYIEDGVAHDPSFRYQEFRTKHGKVT